MLVGTVGLTWLVWYQTWFGARLADDGLTALSVQELGELVANLTTRNNQLRDEIGTLERQRDAV